MDGVVNLALTFGTLLSSQGTDASFVLTLTGFLRALPFGISCFQLSRPNFLFPPPAGAGISLSDLIGFPAIQTLASLFRLPDHRLRSMQSQKSRLGSGLGRRRRPPNHSVVMGSGRSTTVQAAGS
ncbi:hypothetical protein DT019_19550 [Streptomyces sp. SDr-06]|nr:hypothetical protein DT019_19550 [Streptomyces sp. SDr-06]